MFCSCVSCFVFRAVCRKGKEGREKKEGKGRKEKEGRKRRVGKERKGKERKGRNEDIVFVDCSVVLIFIIIIGLCLMAKQQRKGGGEVRLEVPKCK